MPRQGVCVIIVNFNAGAWLPRCLDALAAQTRPPDQAILVDNGSSDGSVEGLTETYPWLQVLPLGANLGFAAANNRGVQAAPGRRWIALLNPDAFPAPDWLERLLDDADRHPDFQVFGSRLLDATRPELLDGDGDCFHVSGGVWRAYRGWPVQRAPAAGREIFSPCAAAALYDRNAFLAVGGFDERFFCYLEDVDLGFRLRRAGYRAWQAVDARVLHQGSGVTGELSDFSLYHIQRNLLWTYWKNMPSSLWWRHLPQHLLFNLLGFAALVRRGRAGLAWRAKRDGIKQLPALWRERRQAPPDRVAPAELVAFMESGWWTAYRRQGRAGP